jgi:pimeloyl-ACP methyl ester carboxylesterase
VQPAIAPLEQVEVDGRTLAYRRAGAGPPLVLLHGAWSDSREWRWQLEGLADEFTVVAWDAPGCGGSVDPPDSFRLPDYADAVANLIAALELERPHLLGMSFGGGLALEVYRRHPELPRSLVLASAYAGWAGSLSADVVAERVRRALDEAERPPEEWVADYVPGFFAGPVTQESIDEMIAIMSDVRSAGIKPMVQAFAEADLRGMLADIAVPTLLLYGELDERSPRAVAEAMHAGISGSELVYLRGVGHVSNIEAPAAFDAEVRRFLRSVPG